MHNGDGALMEANCSVIIEFWYHNTIDDELQQTLHLTLFDICYNC